VDAVIIGGGVTGLASAAAIARRGVSVCVIERHGRPGLDTSTHNSGVIHAGLYYPTDSLKARLCVDGRRLMYDFCAAHGVPHSRCGKIIIAAEPHEIATLETLKALGDRNGVEELELVDRDFVKQREPFVRARAALYSPASGVVNAEAYVRALLRSAESAGAIFLPGTRVVGAETGPRGVVLRTGHETIVARQVVNAAGLYADDVSRLLGGEEFTIHPCRGEYVELIPAKRSIVHSLVYPLPHEHGLGVHVVKTTDGVVWLGPTATYQARKDDYENNRLTVDAFLEPAKLLLPELELADLRLSGSGIRAKLQGPHDPFADFLIRRDPVNPSIVQAAGIDSPGLTSSLAIGQLVDEIVAEGAR